MAGRKNPGLVKACPTKCSGGYQNRQRSLGEYEESQIPADVLEEAKNGLHYCTYCDAVWEDRGSYKKLYGFLSAGTSGWTRYKGF
jgi:hypothetical protein